MGRTQVRSQLVSFLATGSGLDAVLSTMPKVLDFEQYATVGAASRAVGVVLILGDHEMRIAIGGAHSGWKRTDFDVVVQVFHHSVEPDATAAMTDLDSRIDTLKAKLRSDHNFGDTTGTLVWQGAEPIIDGAYGEPMLDDYGAVESWAEVRFTVTQMVQA